MKGAPALAAATLAALAPWLGSGALAGSSAATPDPNQQTGLRPGLQLQAMRTAIAAAPQYFEAYNPDCGRTIAMLTWVGGDTLAGNFRDQSGNCYVWLNLGHSTALDAREICKTTLHETGHLTGLGHSPDPSDVMYSPFEAQPIPAVCSSPLGTSAARRPAT